MASAGFAPLSRRGAGRLPKPVSIDGHTWPVFQVLFEPATADCTQQGRADQALETPDGRRLVFLASPESLGGSGAAREKSPWPVYVQELPDGQPRAVVRGFSTGGSERPSAGQVGPSAVPLSAWIPDLGATVLTAILGAWLTLVHTTSASWPFTERRQASVERLRNGLVFKPVPQTTVATVAATDAWETVKREFPELAEQPVEATLALVTTESYGETGPDGSVTPAYNNRLAWVFRVRDVEILPLLGWGLVPASDDKARERPKITDCVIHIVVDAVDGALGPAWQSGKVG